jgi:hypothetical protein
MWCLCARNRNSLSHEKNWVKAISDPPLVKDVQITRRAWIKSIGKED